MNLTERKKCRLLSADPLKGKAGTVGNALRAAIQTLDKICKAGSSMLTRLQGVRGTGADNLPLTESLRGHSVLEHHVLHGAEFRTDDHFCHVIGIDS